MKGIYTQTYIKCNVELAPKKNMLVCQRCTNVWFQRDDKKKPQTCPHCRSKLWDKPRIRNKQKSGSIGRPTLSKRDQIYSILLKVYTTFSLRRFMSDAKYAHEKGYISKIPCYASIGHFMQKKNITPILIDLVKSTSLPLKTVESDFAIDSTGFGTSKFDRWYSFKHGKEIKSRKWVKCHFITGVNTNIITSVKITSQFEADSPQLPELIEKTDEHFDLKEFSADKAYLSQKNLELIENTGATPYIPFKINSRSGGNGRLWKKLYHYFSLKHEEFMDHYHKRSNVESTVYMVKSKFGDHVRSKTWNAQVNEVLCKIICHNIVVLIHEMEELELNVDYMKENNM